MPTISTLTVDVESNTSKFASGLKIATAGLAVLAAGAAYAFGQFEESEKVGNQTVAVLKSTGDAANTTAKHVTDLAGALSMKAGIDDEAIQSGENMILTFKNISNEAGKGNDIFDQTTKAVLDMSVAMGQDMKSSAIQVGKALNDPIAGMSALSRVGVTFSEQQKKQITQMQNHNNLLGAQKIILGELTSEFGGSAAAQATATGKMQVALGNLAETIGGVVAPIFEKVATAVAKVVEWLGDKGIGGAVKAAVGWFKQLSDSSKALIVAVGAIGVALAIAFAPAYVIAVALVAIAALVVANWNKIKTAIEPLIPVIKQIAAAVGQTLFNAWQALWPVLQKVAVVGLSLLGALQTLWPVIQKIAEFVAGTAVKAWHAITQAVDKLWPDILKLWNALQPGVKLLATLAVAILKVVGFILMWALKAIPPLITIIATLIDWLIKIITVIVKVANAISRWVADVIGFFARLVVGVHEKFGQVVDFIRDIPDKIRGFFGNAASWLYNAGKDVLVGLWNGMKSMFTTIWNGLTGWVSGLVEHVKSFLHIGSPSKVFEEIGVNMMAGMDRGIRSGSADVRGTLKGITGAVSGIGGGGVGGNVTINVQGYVGNEAQLAQKIQEALLKLKARNGTTGL